MVNTEKQLELRHYRCVVAVAHSLHFARAAAELGISPPALSKQLQEAEGLLGTRLFLRSKRSVAITSAGALFVAEARRALEQVAQAQEVARRAGRGELGRLEIGYVGSAVYSGVLQRAFARFRASHPGVTLQSREVAMELLPGMLEQGELDFAFVRPPLRYPEGIDSVVLLRDRFVLAVPEHSELADGSGMVPPQALAQLPLIVPEQEWGTLETARRGGFAPQVVSRPGSLLSVLAQVSLGAGCAIVPQAVLTGITLPGVRYRELAGAPIASEIAVAFRRHEQNSAARAWIAQLRAAAVP